MKHFAFSAKQVAVASEVRGAAGQECAQLPLLKSPGARNPAAFCFHPLEPGLDSLLYYKPVIALQIPFKKSKRIANPKISLQTPMRMWLVPQYMPIRDAPAEDVVVSMDL